MWVRRVRSHVVGGAIIVGRRTHSRSEGTGKLKTLLILRHAKSSWNHPNRADIDRPLNGRGKRDAPRMGKLLVHENLVPDAIVSSSAVRARMTSEAVALASGFDGTFEIADELYAADTRDYLGCIRERPDRERRVLVVGHNPTVEDLIEQLTGEDERMPTAALAQIALSIDAWSELTLNGEGTLIHLWRPRDLPA